MEGKEITTNSVSLIKADSQEYRITSTISKNPSSNKLLSSNPSLNNLGRTLSQLPNKDFVPVREN